MRIRHLLTTLIVLLVAIPCFSQSENKMTGEEVEKFYKEYPFTPNRGRVFSVESEFVMPEGFKRIPDSKMSRFQAWVSRLPLWHNQKGVATMGLGLAFEANEITRCVMFPWRSSKMNDFAIPLQIQLEWLLREKKADNWQIIPKAGDTMSYARWLVTSPVYDSRMRLMMKPSEPRIPDSLEYNRFFNLVAENSNYLSLEMNSDIVAEADLRPGDFLIARSEPGTSGRVYIIYCIAQNKAGEKRYIIATGCNPPCDFYLPLFNGDPKNPWITLDQLKGLPPSEFTYKGFFRLRMPK